MASLLKINEDAFSPALMGSPEDLSGTGQTGVCTKESAQLRDFKAAVADAQADLNKKTALGIVAILACAVLANFGFLALWNFLSKATVPDGPSSWVLSVGLFTAGLVVSTVSGAMCGASLARSLRTHYMRRAVILLLDKFRTTQEADSDLAQWADYQIGACTYLHFDGLWKDSSEVFWSVIVVGLLLCLPWLFAFSWADFRVSGAIVALIVTQGLLVRSWSRLWKDLPKSTHTEKDLVACEAHKTHLYPLAFSFNQPNSEALASSRSLKVLFSAACVCVISAAMVGSAETELAHAKGIASIHSLNERLLANPSINESEGFLSELAASRAVNGTRIWELMPVRAGSNQADVLRCEWIRVGWRVCPLKGIELDVYRLTRDLSESQLFFVHNGRWPVGPTPMQRPDKP